jgi:prepilin-type N-terminal cleavage/methylation domain-containing protein
MKSNTHTRRACFRGGFTLLELLAVLVIIAILAGMILAAAQRIIKTARVNQANAAARALRMALVNYRHDYNHWPVPGSLVPTIDTNGNHVLFATNSDGIANAAIFAMLQYNSADNPFAYRYLDNTTLYTIGPNGQGTVHAAYQSGSGPFPVGYVSRQGPVHYFTVKINFDWETAEVGKQPGD